MTGERTYYDLFGVQREASARQIRDAYLRLLKQHHPDLAGARSDGSCPQLVPLLNRCYAVLRDPAKRAAYDAQLAREQATASCQSMPRDAPKLSVPRRRPLRRRWTAVAVISASAAILLALQAAATYPAAVSAGWLNSLWAGAPLPEARLQFVPPPQTRARYEARLATLLSSDAAVAWSRRCFSRASNSGDALAAELCVIFDEAFVYWRRGPDDTPAVPIYFNEEIARIRHAQALAAFGGKAEHVAAALRDIAFSALLMNVRDAAPPVDRGSPAPRRPGAASSHQGGSSRTGTDAGGDLQEPLSTV